MASGTVLLAGSRSVHWCSNGSCALKALLARSAGATDGIGAQRQLRAGPTWCQGPPTGAYYASCSRGRGARRTPPRGIGTTRDARTHARRRPRPMERAAPPYRSVQPRRRRESRRPRPRRPPTRVGHTCGPQPCARGPPPLATALYMMRAMRALACMRCMACVARGSSYPVASCSQQPPI
jgi:hypothetical protein